MGFTAFVTPRFLQKILFVVVIIFAYFLTTRYHQLVSNAGKLLYRSGEANDVDNADLALQSLEGNQNYQSSNQHTATKEEDAQNVVLAPIGSAIVKKIGTDEPESAPAENWAPEPPVPDKPAARYQGMKYLVPNYAHFIWYTSEPKELQFHHYLSILSAQRIMKAEKIYWHHNMEPTGKYWEEAKENISTLILQYRDPPTSMFGVNLTEPKWDTSYSNADRIKILQEYGGVYYDLDVILTKPLDPLRVYPATVGFELPNYVCGGFIMSQPNSTFIYLWIDTMLNDYQVDKWAFISGYIPTVLVKRFREMGIVHIEADHIHFPNHSQMMFLIGPEPYDWSKNYAVHLWHRLWRSSKHWPRVKVNDPESIKTMNNTYGQIAREVYYGNSDFIYE